MRRIVWTLVLFTAAVSAHSAEKRALLLPVQAIARRGDGHLVDRLLLALDLQPFAAAEVPHGPVVARIPPIGIAVRWIVLR